MGCVNNKETDIGHPSQFKKNQQQQDSVFKPLFSTLYNMLRKKNDVQIIRNSKIQQPMFLSQLSYNTTTLKPNDIKMLCNFKNILLIDPSQDIIHDIKRNSTPKKIFTLTQDQAKIFLSLFPIYVNQESRLEPKMIPILAFYSQQTSKNRESRMVFLHSQKYRNDKLYKKLQIDHIVVESDSKSSKAIIENLSKVGCKKVLYLHSSTASQQNLLNILCEWVSKEYGIASADCLNYFNSIFPQSKTTDNLFPRSQNIIKAQAQNSTSLTQTYENTLKHLYEQMGSDESASQKIDRACNLIINLLSNIYNNKQSQNFRKVRKTNKQVNQLLGKYKTGIKLLQEIGFMDEGAFFVNNTDGKYLKLYRTDFDVAYKKFITRK